MNWAKLLPSAEFTYNNSRSSSTKMTPFKALYGYDPDLRIDISPEDSAIKGRHQQHTTESHASPS